MARRTRALLVAALSTASRFVSCLAQNVKPAFQWKFANNVVSTSLSTCDSYGLIVQNRTDNASAIGVAPYYMIAYTPNGIPTTSLVGTDPNNLTWQVNQPPGTNMLLTIADSNNDAGGFPPTVYTTIAGSSTACVPPKPAVNITVVQNVTGTLFTCKPWGLRVYGGTLPYTISLAALSSTLVTNVTLGPHDDVFTFIDRADPNGMLMAAVSDATGQWGTSTPLVPTAGNTNVSCVGLVSSSGNSSAVNQHPKPPAKTLPVGGIVGVVIASVVVTLLASLAFVMWRRRVAKAKELEPEPAVLPEAWAPPLMATPFGADDSSQARPLTLPGSSARPGKEAIFRAREAAYALANAPPGTPSGATPSLTSGQSIDPTQPPQAHASGPLQISTTTSFGSSSTPSATSSGKPGRRRQNQAPSVSSAGIAGVGAASGLPNTWAVEPEIIIQHRDGGTVQEIPPPYVDRSAPGGAGAGPSGASRPGPNVLSHQTGQSGLSTTQSMSEIDRESSRWSQGTLLGGSGTPGPSGVAPGEPPIVHGAAGQSEP